MLPALKSTGNQMLSKRLHQIEAPEADGLQSMRLRGYVVWIDVAAKKRHSTVGVVFYGLSLIFLNERKA